MPVKVKLKEGIIPPKSESIQEALRNVGITFSKGEDGNYIIVTEDYLDKVFRMELVKVTGTTKVISREQIKQWFQEGKEGGATHMITLYRRDWFREFRVFVKPEEDVKEIFQHWEDQDQVMEVYSLSMDMESQLNETRAFHLD